MESLVQVPQLNHPRPINWVLKCWIHNSNKSVVILSVFRGAEL